MSRGVAASAVEAYVRIRPLLTEQEAADSELPALAAAGPSPLLAGFTNVLRPSDCNRDVYEKCLEPKLSMVLRGGAVSLFSYGYTGGGKTHTILGYGEERGLTFLAAERLISELSRACSSEQQQETAHRPFLRVTACEIYDDRVFDLLGAEKVECSLRVGEDGQLQVVGAAQSEQMSNAVTAQSGGALATLVTRTTSLRCVRVYEPGHLQEIAASCVSKRAVGSSTEHEQSSRSHALLMMDVSTPAVLDARAAVEHAKALSGPLRNDLENALAEGLADLFCGVRGAENCTPVLRMLNNNGTPGEAAYVTISPFDGSEISWYEHAAAADFEVDTAARGERPKEFGLKGRPGELHTLEEWADVLGAPGGCGGDFFGVACAPKALVRLGVLTRTSFAEAGEWERRHAHHAARRVELSRRLDENAAALEQAKAALEDAQARGGVAVGGQLLLVDLAGADYDHRAGAAQKESAAINKSLLALKECLRALAVPKGAKGAARPKFRDTKLTRMLEDALAPNASSARRNRESHSVMLVNVSPAASLEQPTMNSLRYGQLFGASGGNNSGGGKGGARR